MSAEGGGGGVGGVGICLLFNLTWSKGFSED